MECQAAGLTFSRRVLPVPLICLRLSCLWEPHFHAVCVHVCLCWEVAEAGVGDKPWVGVSRPLLEEASGHPS